MARVSWGGYPKREARSAMRFGPWRWTSASAMTRLGRGVGSSVGMTLLIGMRSSLTQARAVRQPISGLQKMACTHPAERHDQSLTSPTVAYRSTLGNVYGNRFQHGFTIDGGAGHTNWPSVKLRRAGPSQAEVRWRREGLERSRRRSHRPFGLSLLRGLVVGNDGDFVSRGRRRVEPVREPLPNKTTR